MKLRFWEAMVDLLGLCERALRHAYAVAREKREAAK